MASLMERVPLGLLNQNEVSESIDEIERKIYESLIVEIFFEKGWGLYESPAKIEKFQELKKMVEMGRAKEVIQGRQYVPLPLIEDDSNWGFMYSILQSIKYYPYLFHIEYDQIDPETKEKFHNLIGIYCIESLIMKSPFLIVGIDKRLSVFSKKFFKEEIKEPCIEIHLSRIEKFLRNFLSRSFY